MAHAWLAASEDPIAGADQKSHVFFGTIHRRFIDNGPHPAYVVGGRYGFRTADRFRENFSDLSADAQTFGTSLRKVRTSNPTGVNEDGVLPMTVGVHLGRTEKMQ